MVSQRYFYGLGRRKCAIARVRLYPGGTGAIVVNGKPLEEWVVRPSQTILVEEPLRLTETVGKLNATVKVDGGGSTGWTGAIRLGIARALLAMDDRLKPVLRQHGLLTRDPRVKERKKYGLKRARKAPQYTKR